MMTLTITFEYVMSSPSLNGQGRRVSIIEHRSESESRVCDEARTCRAAIRGDENYELEKKRMKNCVFKSNMKSRALLRIGIFVEWDFPFIANVYLDRERGKKLRQR